MSTSLRFCNIGYDFLTIFISIADVATDIIVLIGYYEKERFTFFIISLIILILAQCSYSIAFALRFNTIDSWKTWQSLIAFCCLLPFGTFVAFFMYFASETNGFDGCHSFFQYTLGLDADSWFSPRSRDSKMVKWIKAKLDRHLGFILEAVIEAFPQSLIQITAIVLYQEANYVSIISILLSMFSVMTKSLMLSQGVEKWTFIMTWLCVVTDFFGIFFTLTWVFYSNPLIFGYSYFGEYFNIFGFVWFCKLSFTTLLPVLLALIIFFGFGYGFLYCAILCNTHEEGSKRCGLSLFWCCLSPFMAIMCAMAAVLACEVFCFSIFAFAVYLFGTSRIADYSSESVHSTILTFLDFLYDGKDKKLRVLAINHGVNRTNKTQSATTKYVDRILKESEYSGLAQISYADIRNNSSDPRAANLFYDFFVEVKDEYERIKNKNNSLAVDIFFDKIYLITFASFFFFFGPILLISKIVQVLFPYAILIYMAANNLLWSGQIDMLQRVMLLIYVCLQLVLLMIGAHAMRIQWWLWHIEPGSTYVSFSGMNNKLLKKNIYRFYDNVCWYPQIEPIIINAFGQDIGEIIMDYCKSIQMQEDVLQHFI